MWALKPRLLTTLQPQVIVHRGFPTVRLPTVFALKSFSWLLEVWNVTSFVVRCTGRGRQRSFLNLMLYFSGSTNYTLKSQCHWITHIHCVQVWISWWVKFMPWHWFCKISIEMKRKLLQRGTSTWEIKQELWNNFAPKFPQAISHLNTYRPGFLKKFILTQTLLQLNT